MATDKDGNTTGTSTSPKPDSSVKELQRVLAAYATANNYPAANPGPETGFVDIMTTMAVVAITQRIPKLPTEISVLFYTAGPLMLTADGRTAVFALIRRFASYISTAVLAIQVINTDAGGPAAPTPGVKPPHAAIVSALISQAVSQLPGATQGAIYFHDTWKKVFRVAKPAQDKYIEIEPAQSPPAAGREVDRSTFMKSIGRWWATTGNLAVFTGIFVVGGGLAAFAIRRRRHPKDASVGRPFHHDPGTFADQKLLEFAEKMHSIPRKAQRDEIYGGVTAVVDRRHAQAIFKKVAPTANQSAVTAALVILQDRLDERTDLDRIGR